MTTVTETLETLIQTFPEKQPVDLTDDPIALSCAAYRRYHDNTSTLRERFPDLRLMTVEHDDRAMAESIRDYYRNKIAIKALTDANSMTPYYQDLYELLIGQVQLERRHMGMIYRLPYFYVEDQARIQLGQLVKTDLNPDYRTVYPSIDYVRQEKLEPVMRIFRGRKDSEVTEFWFRDVYDWPVLLSVGTNNNLLSIIEDFFNRPSITLEAGFFIGQVRGNDFFHYYMTKPRLVSAEHV